LPTRSKPLLVYDGDCHFCRRWITRWQSLTGERVEYAPFQEVAGLFPEIPLEKFGASVQLIETDGLVFEGAEAVFRSLAYAPGKSWLLRVYRKVPAAARLSEWVYRFVAGHRPGFSRLTRWLWGRHLERPTYFLPRWLFLRILGAIYLAAFLSLGSQLSGLIGKDGILPSGRFLEAVAASLGPERYRLLPTLCWFNTGDGLPHLLWKGGAFLSCLLMLGVAPVPVLFLLWAFYLSLSTVCRDFLGFQWDILLLETGFLAIFFAPGRFLPRLSRESPPSPVVLWLLRWLLFRLLFSSGVVKLASGDPTWWNLTALTFHYETQPLPTWIGWYAHQLPLVLQKFSAAVMFVIELGVPFLIFLPRRPRFVAFGLIVFFQTLIALTGNYCFFNLLTLALCLLLLDDASLGRFFPGEVAKRAERPRPRGVGKIFRRLAVAGVAILVLPLGCMALSRSFRRPIRWPSAMERLEAWVVPFRIVSGYGLFARMTNPRDEIIIEGSRDGQTWVPYEFRWKPGDPLRRPGFVEPHQPRLDWQMWFAALGDYRSPRNLWFRNLLIRLLQGSREVLALLDKNPFPDAPPRYVRAQLYEYHFTDPAMRRAGGGWWRRELKRPYCPVLSLRGG